MTMTIGRQKTFVRLLPSAAVSDGTISWFSLNAANQWSLIEAGNFATSVAGATTTPTNATVGGSTISWFDCNTASPWSLNEAGNFATSVAGATSDPLVSAPVGGSTISALSAVGVINNWLPIQAGTFATGPTGSVDLTGGSLPNAVGSSAISSFGSVGSEAPDWTSAAHLFTVPLSSSEPVISLWELFDEYRELGEAFGQMAEPDEDDDSWIEAPVLNIARNVAVELMTSAFPVPQIFNHGPKSLVFNWIYGRDNLYLTVSSRNVSILVSTPEKIKRRVEYPLGEFLKHEHAVPLLQLAYWEQQAAITVSGTSE
jgi:hypothetical protein